MSFICIANNGTTDFNTIRLIGLSSKRNAASIGQFGSGFKYGCALLARNQIGMTITIGLDVYTMEIEPVHKEICFRCVKQDGSSSLISTSIHIDFGQYDWTKLWFAFREFICNAYDADQDFTQQFEDQIKPEVGKTKVYIPQTYQTMSVMGEIYPKLRMKERPLYQSSCGKIRVFPRMGEVGQILVKGVCVANIGDSAYDYELPVRLSESRQVDQGDAKYSFANSVGLITNQKILEDIFTVCTRDKQFENITVYGIARSPETVVAAFKSVFGPLAVLCNNNEVNEVMNLGQKPISNVSYRVFWEGAGVPVYKCSRKFKGRIVDAYEYNTLVNEAGSYFDNPPEVVFYEPEDGSRVMGSHDKDVSTVYINSTYFNDNLACRSWLICEMAACLNLSTAEMVARIIKKNR